MEDIIFVTAYKENGCYKWPYFKRTDKEYYNYFLNLTKNFQYKLIFYVEDNIKEELLKNNCNENINFEDIIKVNTFYKEKELLNSEELNKNPKKWCAEYNSITYSKINLVAYTKQKYNNYKYYSWIDFDQDNQYIYSNLKINNLSEKIIYQTINKIDNLNNDLLKSDNVYIPTGSFIVPNNLVEYFENIYENKMKLCHETFNDQSIILQLYNENKNIFHLISHLNWHSLYTLPNSLVKIDIIIINLLNHVDKKKKMIENLNNLNITNYKFFDAIDGNNLHDCDIPFKVIPNWECYFKKRKITVGEIGCALSHYSIWKYIVNNKINKILILEDDVDFSENFNDIYNKIQDTNIDLFYLGRNALNKHKHLKLGTETEINDLFVEAKTSYNTQSYIITYDCAKKLLNSNYLENLLPVDDFLSIMYDEKYPFSYKSLFPSNKIQAYALKNDITSQSNHISSIDTSCIYEEFSTWDIEINNFTKYKNIDDFNKEIDNFLIYHNTLNTNFFLNIKNDRFSFIEKFIYDNIKFHTKRLNIELNNKHVSFWGKLNEYNFEYLHMHFDHCDYESRVYKSEKIKPIFTSLIYFNDNFNPTLISDIDRNMMNNNVFHHEKNNKLILSFPKKLKNIVFNSNKLHGESYLSDKISERKALLIALWDNDNKPLHIPYFDKNIYNYYLFTNHNIHIHNKNDYDKKEIFEYKNTNDEIETIKIVDNQLINKKFFEKMLNREKTIMYPFIELLKNIKHHSIILNFEDVKKNYENYENMNCYIELFEIKIKNDILKQDQILNDLLSTEIYLQNNIYSDVEKYVYSISMYHINRLKLKNISISYYFGNTHKEIKTKTPLMTCLSFFEDGCLYISDIDNESYKYKNFNSKLFAMNTKKFDNIIFSSKYYKHTDGLIIHFWKNEKQSIFEYEESNSIFENDFSKKLCKKNNIPVQINKNEGYFENILYKNKLEKIDGLFIVTMKNENIIIDETNHSKKIKQMKFLCEK